MKTITALIILTILATSSLALEIDPFNGPKPIAVLMQTNPWLMVLGADTPKLTIYEDGQVIYLQDEKGKPSHYLHVQLPEKELNEIKKQLLSFGNYEGIKREYDLAPNVFDLPETKIYLSFDKTKLVTNVYGLMLPETELLASSSYSTAQKPDDLPGSLEKLLCYLSNLRFKASRKWGTKIHRNHGVAL